MLSWSRHLDPAIVGREHYDVAQGVRRLLRRYREIQEGGAEGGCDGLTAEDATVVARARRVQRFLSQPFFVATQFTGLEGKYVKLEETVRSFERVVAGEFDQLPEQAFYMVAGIDDVVAKAKQLATA